MSTCVHLVSQHPPFVGQVECLHAHKLKDNRDGHAELSWVVDVTVTRGPVRHDPSKAPWTYHELEECST